MKKSNYTYYPIFIAIISIFILFSCQDSHNNSKKKDISDKNNHNMPLLAVKNILDFGEINKEENPEKELSIELKNIGSTPLTIIDIHTSCGCLKPTYSKRPILKGEKKSIKLKIYTSKQKGYFNKSMIIKTNAKNSLEIIRIKGIIR